MIQWGEQACIDGKPAPLVSCRGMVTPPTNVKYALSEPVEPHGTCVAFTLPLAHAGDGRRARAES